MFEIQNMSPVNVTAHIGRKTVKFQPGERRGVWEIHKDSEGNDLQPDYFTHAEMKILTNPSGFGKEGLMFIDHDGGRGKFESVRTEGELRFLNAVRDNIDQFLQANRERKNHGAMAIDLWTRPELIELIKKGEKLAKFPRHDGVSISLADVEAKFQQIWGGIIVQQGGNGNGDSKELAVLKAENAELKAKNTEMDDKLNIILGKLDSNQVLPEKVEENADSV